MSNKVGVEHQPVILPSNIEIILQDIKIRPAFNLPVFHGVSRTGFDHCSNGIFDW